MSYWTLRFTANDVHPLRSIVFPSFCIHTFIAACERCLTLELVRYCKDFLFLASLCCRYFKYSSRIVCELHKVVLMYFGGMFWGQTLGDILGHQGDFCGTCVSGKRKKSHRE